MSLWHFCTHYLNFIVFYCILTFLCLVMRPYIFHGVLRGLCFFVTLHYSWLCRWSWCLTLSVFIPLPTARTGNFFQKCVSFCSWGFSIMLPFPSPLWTQTLLDRDPSPLDRDPLEQRLLFWRENPVSGTDFYWNACFLQKNYGWIQWIQWKHLGKTQMLQAETDEPLLRKRVLKNRLSFTKCPDF